MPLHNDLIRASRDASGKVWNKEDDRREKSEKAGQTQGQEVDWFLVLSPEDNLYSTSYSTIVSFVRSWAGSKAWLFFFHLGPRRHPRVPAALRIRRSCLLCLVRKSGTERRGIAGSTGERRSAPFPPPVNLRDGTSRDLPSDTAVINHSTVSCSSVTVALETVASSSRSGWSNPRSRQKKRNASAQSA